MHEPDEREQRRRRIAENCRRIANVTRWGFAASFATAMLCSYYVPPFIGAILIIELALAFVVSPCLWMMARAVEGRVLLPRPEDEAW